MPTAITEQYSMMVNPSYSNNSTNKSYKSTQAPIITRATVVSFEKRLADQKIWYTIRVEPLGQKKYFISKKYEDFSQFSQKLHEQFSINKYHVGSRFLPPKIKNRLVLLPTSKQIHAQRVQELNQFLSILFYKQSMITDSFLVLEFFSCGSSSNNYMQQQQQQQQTAADLNVENSYLFMNDDAAMDDSSNDENMQQQQQQQQQETTQSRWKRLRCTSFLANKSSIPNSTTTSTGLSSLCSQAANKIMPSWHRNNTTAPLSPQPSLSTPAKSSSSKLMTGQLQQQQKQQQQQQRKQVLKKSKSSLGIYSTVIQHPLDVPPVPISPSISSTITYNNYLGHNHQIKSTIKIKVIYDVDNIIVIQVPRSIALDDLRRRIAQKFSDPSMGGRVHLDKQELVLLFHDNSSSCCSIATSSSTSTTRSSAANSDMVLPAVLINKEQDLKQIMHTKWSRLEKVTLRCIM
jgi:hypothetical protein